MVLVGVEGGGLVAQPPRSPAQGSAAASSCVGLKMLSGVQLEAFADSFDLIIWLPRKTGFGGRADGFGVLRQVASGEPTSLS